MNFLDFLREKISPHSTALLLYHKFIAILAAVFYGFPGNRIKVIAVTGTKGKSTVVHLLAKILQTAGHKIGAASTIHFQIGDTIWPNDTKQTTQGRFALQKLLSAMVREKCEYAVIEVTSHAMIQSRIWGINVDTAVLTNIQRDHIEYHGGFERYLYAKGLLFAHLARAERKEGIKKTAVLPIEDPNVNYFETFMPDRKISYGINQGMIHAENIQLKPDGSTFILKVPNDEIEMDLKLPGENNIKNAIAAAAAAISFGIKLFAIKKGLESVESIPGRMEAIRAGQNFTVIVDYAHTPESLEKLLQLFRPLTAGKLFLVFGATGGGRDKSKRKDMGRAAHENADYIIVTDDDPYTENRIQIIEQVAEGIPRKEGENFWKIRDRREAIRLAILLAKKHDTVLIAGKGCEPIQIIGKKRIEWDDRKVVREILSSEMKVSL